MSLSLTPGDIAGKKEPWTAGRTPRRRTAGGRKARGAAPGRPVRELPPGVRSVTARSIRSPPTPLHRPRLDQPTSQMGRFETELLANNDNLAALANLSGIWFDRVHHRNPPKLIVLDMDGSVSLAHGEQEGTAHIGHFACTCYHPLILFNQRRIDRLRPTPVPA